MGELQWALLIVCVVLVVGLYVLSRRGKLAGGERDAAASQAAHDNSDQLDLLATRPDGDFDEYGVGRKRRRGEGAVPPREPPAPSMATLLHPLPGQTPVAPRPADLPMPAPAPAAPVSATKLVALIVAPAEETDLLGPQLHAALAEQGLKFGEGEVYHRSIGGRVVYSVASLLKPGKLIPAEAENFSTKGLTVVLNLPGPVQATVALDDMLATTRALAAALKAEIFNAQRQRLTDEVASALRADVQAWARASKLA